MGHNKSAMRAFRVWVCSYCELKFYGASTAGFFCARSVRLGSVEFMEIREAKNISMTFDLTLLFCKRNMYMTD